ncbi:DUF1003 domain-containing protein [Labrys sp. KB_33_2]|uniref:DUF1003 domain-containing protein n=1 Tax=unclassified Labrys (in: a-proteobacteria) TaxID=2688601 RepID=UPI003EBD3578
MSLIAKAHQLHDEELALLHRLRQSRRVRRGGDQAAMSFGARVADAVAATMGSWPFIIVQSAVLAAWVVLNVIAFVQHWDPYPFILLNLALSFQAAYAAPFIMMSQNRQATIDRAAATHDYDVNTKAELEIELLHEKIDFLRETQVVELMQLVKRLEEKLDAADRAPPA